MKNVLIYTDGACLGNPGPGGYGVILKTEGKESELSQGYLATTNNRMEIRAVIAGLTALKQPCSVTVFSDSQYVVNAMSKGWARKWQANGWMRNRKDKALNPDLWEQLLRLDGNHQVQYQWVRGHAGHAENERCDALAVAAANASQKIEDEGFSRG